MLAATHGAAGASLVDIGAHVGAAGAKLVAAGASLVDIGANVGAAAATLATTASSLRRNGNAGDDSGFGVTSS